MALLRREPHHQAARWNSAGHVLRAAVERDRRLQGRTGPRQLQRAEAAKAEAAAPTVSAPADGAAAEGAAAGGQVSLFGIGGQKKKKKGEQTGTKKSPGEIRIQKGKRMDNVCILQFCFVLSSLWFDQGYLFFNLFLIIACIELVCWNNSIPGFELCMQSW